MFVQCFASDIFLWQLLVSFNLSISEHYFHLAPWRSHMTTTYSAQDGNLQVETSLIHAVAVALLLIKVTSTL